MNLRTGNAIPKWKIVLKQVFEEADGDMSGTVTKKEWRKIMESPTVAAKFEKTGISKIVLENTFNFLDQDNSDDLTEDELVSGFLQLVEQGYVKGTFEQIEEER